MRLLSCLLLLALSGASPPARAAATTTDEPQIVEVHAAGDVQLLWLSPGDHLLLGRVPFRYPGGPAIVARLDGRILYVNGRPAGADLVDLTDEEAAGVLRGQPGVLPGIAIDSRNLAALTTLLAARGLRALALSVDDANSDLSPLTHLAGALRALWIKTIHCEDDACFRDATLTAEEWRPLARLGELRYLYTDSGPAAGSPVLLYLSRLEHLVLADEIFTDAVMPHVGKLTGLTTLDLSSTAITAAGLGPLAKLRSLRRLRLANGEPNDTTAELLAGLTKLEELDLAGAEISNAGLDRLVRLPALRALDLSDTTLTAEGGPATLARLSALRKLHLGGLELADANFARLAALTRLEWLDLGQTKVTPVGLQHLRALGNLKVLRLGSGGMTDAHFYELWTFTGLKSLTLDCDDPLCCSSSTTAGLAGAEALSDLRILELRAAQLNDAGILRLRELKALRKLSLAEDSCYAENFSITDAGLLLLLPLEHLWVLRLPQSRAELTEEGLTHFRSQRPGCEISWVKHAAP